MWAAPLPKIPLKRILSENKFFKICVTYLQKVGEFGKSPWLVRENEITVALNVHLVVQHDLPWLVVFVDDLGLDALDVLAVVVDVLLWCLPVLQDVVVVSVVNDQDTSGLQHVVHVLYAPLVIPEEELVTYVAEENVSKLPKIPVVVHEMRE